MEAALGAARAVPGYDFQPTTRPILQALVATLGASDTLDCARFLGAWPGYVEATPQSLGEEAVWAVARGEERSLSDLPFESISDAMVGLFLNPLVSPEALGCALRSLRLSWARAIVLGPIRLQMNWRASPQREAVATPTKLHLFPFCQWCHATSDLELCPECSVVAYCSATCRAKDQRRHSAWCLDLLVSRLLWCSFPPEALEFQELACRSPLTDVRAPPDQERSSETLPETWEAYFQQRWPCLSPLEKLLLTESIGGPLTVLRVIEQVGLRRAAPSLRILLVGADCEADQPWLEILPYLQVQDLQLVLVGPHLSDSRWELPLLHRRVTVESHRSLLQDLVAPLGCIDLVVALNSGMVFYPTWIGALRRIVALNCTFAVTAWQLGEAIAVRQLLVDAGFDDPALSLNPFASRCPQRVTDDHGTTNFGSMALLLTKPRAGRVWEELLRPPGGVANPEDLRDTLRLIQGFLTVAVGVNGDLEEILDCPGDFRRKLDGVEETAPVDVVADMLEAYRLLASLT